MNDDNWVTPGNAIWLVIWVGASLWFLHAGFMMAGFGAIIVTMMKVQVLVDEWFEVNDTVEYVTPWNTERVADPSQPKPWWCE